MEGVTCKYYVSEKGLRSWRDMSTKGLEKERILLEILMTYVNIQIIECSQGYSYPYVKSYINVHYFNWGPTQKVTTHFFQ